MRRRRSSPRRSSVTATIIKKTPRDLPSSPPTPGESVASVGGGRQPLARWSKHYDACQECSSTDRPYQGRGLCMRCYQRRRASGTLPAPPPPRWSMHGSCCATCGRTDRKHFGHGLCNECYNAAYLQDAEHRAKARASTSRYRHTERGRSSARECLRRYRERPEVQEYFRWFQRRNRSKRAGVLEDAPNGYEAYVRRAFDDRCAACGSADELVLDHHLPLAAGHSLLHNAVVLCRSCNGRKWNKTPDEFYDTETLDRVECILARLAAGYEHEFPLSPKGGSRP
jgi:5-methylcytosine-specific restriction endonuclease McrA